MSSASVQNQTGLLKPLWVNLTGLTVPLLARGIHRSDWLRSTASKQYVLKLSQFIY